MATKEMPACPADTMPTGAAETIKQKPATSNVDNAAGPSMPLLGVGESGMQKSINPKKDQPKVMRYLR